MKARTAQIVAGVGGIAFALLVAVPSILGPGGVPFARPAADFAAFWTRQSAALEVTHFLNGLAGIGFLLFLAGLHRLLRRLDGENGILATAAALGGVLALSAVLASYGLNQGLATTAAEVGDATSVKLAAVSASTLRHFAFFGTMVVAGASATVLLGALSGVGRWLGLAAVAIVLVQLVATLGIAFPIGSRALNEAGLALFAVWVLLFGIWMVSGATSAAGAATAERA